MSCWVVPFDLTFPPKLVLSGLNRNPMRFCDLNLCKCIFSRSHSCVHTIFMYCADYIYRCPLYIQLIHLLSPRRHRVPFHRRCSTPTAAFAFAQMSPLGIQRRTAVKTLAKRAAPSDLPFAARSCFRWDICSFCEIRLYAAMGLVRDRFETY